jgi:excisionase family DNA binding protein
MERHLEIDELLTEAELQAMLDISRTTLWRLRKSAGLPFGKVGREYRYRKSEVLHWMKDNKYRSNQLSLYLEVRQGR